MLIDLHEKEENLKKRDLERLILLLINSFEEENKTYVNRIDIGRLTHPDMITNMCKACELVVVYKDYK